jgi:hypothetical protein
VLENHALLGARAVVEGALAGVPEKAVITHLFIQYRIKIPSL